MKKSTKSKTKRKARKSNGEKPEKPGKPYEGYPLFDHASGRWAKKIRGKLCYFGRWGNRQNGKVVPVENVEQSAEEALDKFNREWPYLSQGLTPPHAATGDGLTVAELCDEFLNSKRHKLESDELSHRTFEDYHRTCDLLVTRIGKDRRVDDLRPDDFAKLRKWMAAKWGPVKLRNENTRVRMIFKFAYDERLIEKPVHYGQGFDKPSAKMLRKARNEAGPRLFETDELRRILDATDGKVEVDGEKLKADPILKAMVLLGVNCGFGNTDVASLPQTAIDLDNGWVDFPRPKTEIHRRVPLWRETSDALEAAIAVRPVANGRADAGLCFLTSRGTRFVRFTPKEKQEGRYNRRDQISVRFGKLLKTLKINGRKGLGFYTLRHVFETIGGESRDQVAVNSIMGHVDSSMAGVYRERISDERLRAVVETVRAWLFAEGGDDDEK